MAKGYSHGSKVGMRRDSISSSRNLCVSRFRPEPLGGRFTRRPVNFWFHRALLGPCPVDKRGSVLILSLWVTATLSTLGIHQALRISLESKWMGRVQEKRQAWYLAWTGLEVARRRLAQDDPSYDSLSDAWHKIPSAPVSFGPGTFRYQIVDEQARIPLNFLHLFPQSNDLLVKLGCPPHVAAQILSRLTHNPPKPIRHLGELVSFSGMTPEFVTHLQATVTLTGEWPVNMNTASQEVLELFGLSPAGAASIANYRRDNIFTEEGKIIGDLENAQIILPNEDKIVLGQLISSNFLGVRSHCFGVDLEGRTRLHGIRQKIHVVVDRETTGASSVIRGWYEE